MYIFFIKKCMLIFKIIWFLKVFVDFWYFLYRKNHLDFINCIDLTTNILYNNYYDENLIFTSPIEQKINRIENYKNIKHDAFLYYDLDKIQFGLPVNENVLKKTIYNLNNLKGSW